MSITDVRTSLVNEVCALIDRYDGASVRAAVLALVDPPGLDAPGKVSTGAPSTSRRASENITHGSQRWAVLRHLSMERNATAAEIADVLGKSRNQTATRLGELHDAQLVEYVPSPTSPDGLLSRPTGPSDRGLVHRITVAGLAALRSARPNERTRHDRTR